MRYLEQSDSERQQIEWRLAGVRELVLNGDAVSDGEDEQSSQGVEGGNGYTTLWLHFMPLNCTARNDFNGKFYVLYILPPTTH